MSKDNLDEYLSVLRNTKSLLKRGFFPGSDGQKVAQAIGLLTHLMEVAKETYAQEESNKKEA